MILQGHFHIKCSLTEPSQDHVYFSSSKEMWSILSDVRINLKEKNKLRIIIFSYLHLLPDTQSLECSFSDLKNLVLKDKMKCEKTYIGRFTHQWLLAKLVHKDTKQTL